MSDGKQSIEAALRARSLKRIIKAAIFLGCTGLVIYGIVLLAQGEKTTTPDQSTSYAIVGRDHIAEGTVVSTYTTNPPTSGPHYATPAKTGFYDKEFPDERVVHNMEHGDIWISYKPTVSTAVKEALKAFASDPKVIITMRAKNDTDIALAAWGRLDTFNLNTAGELDAARVKDFIIRYRNRGPEQVLDSASMLPQ